MAYLLEAVSGGAVALGRIAKPGIWSVSAVFRRSIHLTDEDGGLICVGCAGNGSIGNGPLNILWAPRKGDRDIFQEIVRGEKCVNKPPVMTIGDRITLHFDATETWSPSLSGESPDSDLVNRGIERMMALSGHCRKAAGGLWPVVSGRLEGGRCAVAEDLDRPLAELAMPGLLSLSRWLDDDSLPVAAAKGLIGLGPGLTPSGDDLLSGVLVALWATGRSEAANRLKSVILPSAQTATNRISYQFLQCAAAGQASEALHGFLKDLLAGGDNLEITLADLERYGHSSGWDMAAGVVMALCDRPLRAA